MKYKTIITAETITAQIDIFVKNCFNFELVFKKDGRTRTNIHKFKMYPSKKYIHRKNTCIKANHVLL